MKIAIIGYGRMGKTIEKIALNKGHEIVLRITSQNIEDLTTANLKKADVAIEFSRPESAFDNIKLCLTAGIPVVSGSTGWLDKMEEAKAICEKLEGAFFYGSNFSIGVNIFFEINRQLATLMNSYSDYDVLMEEVHHTQKLDAPSGTAISLAKGVIENLNRKTNWVNNIAENQTDIGIVSKRIDKVPGTHTVEYQSDIDTIEIKHTAHSRAGFAMGSVMASEWVLGKKGYFEMKDLLFEK